MKGLIFDIKEFALHDGGGIRTTVFLKGCPLRCVWCHNPEGQSPEPEIMKRAGCKHCGRCLAGCVHADCAPFGRCLHACPDGLLSVAGVYWEAGELAERLLSCADIMRSSGGGITLSGGEPLAQCDFSCELLDILGEQKINRAVETCGYSDTESFNKLLSRCDFVYFDLKLADEAEHIKYTGASNSSILCNLELLRSSGVKFRLRTPLIPSITDSERNLAALKEIAENDDYELLPYNKLAGAKYPMLGRKYGFQ